MQPDEDYEALGIDETKLFKKVKHISGSADFSNSQITSLDKLETIGGSANFSNSKITDLGKLTTIGGFAYFNYSQVTNLGNLTTIGSDVFIAGSLLKPEDFVHIKTGKIFKY